MKPIKTLKVSISGIRGVVGELQNFHREFDELIRRP